MLDQCTVSARTEYRTRAHLSSVVNSLSLACMTCTLGAFVAKRREELGIRTQTELGRRTGLPRTTINRIETGVTQLPQPDIRRRLAQALGVSHLDLLVAAGELTEDEIQAAGAEGVVTRDLAGVPDGILALLSSVRWDANPELAADVERILLGVRRGFPTGGR